MLHRRLSGALNVQFENSFGGFQTKFMTEVFANTESFERQLHPAVHSIRAKWPSQTN